MDSFCKSVPIVLFANGERGLRVCTYLVENTFHISSIITTKKSFSLFTESFSSVSISVLESINSPNSIEYLRGFSPGLFLVAGFSQIFKKEILCIPKYGTINLHEALCHIIEEAPTQLATYKWRIIHNNICATNG